MFVTPERIREELIKLSSEPCYCGFCEPADAGCGQHGSEQYYLFRMLCYYCLGKRCNKCNQTGLNMEEEGYDGSAASLEN